MEFMSNIDWHVERLNSFTASPFASLTMAAHRSLLSRCDASETIAVGAYGPDGPAGLALAAIRENGIAMILSVYVAPDNRRRGIGKELVQTLEQALLQHGLSQARFDYACSVSNAPIIE